MALSLGANHPLVRLYSRIEFNFGKRSDYSFCVTRAMKDDLRERTGKKYEIQNKQKKNLNWCSDSLFFGSLIQSNRFI